MYIKKLEYEKVFLFFLLNCYSEIDFGSSDSKNGIFKKEVTKNRLIFNDHCSTYHNERQNKTYK